MNTCPKGIFISIWHLPVEIKVHQENIRTKRETSEAYSEPCQKSKMKFFLRKYLPAFSYELLSLLSKLIYTGIFRTQLNI